MSDRFDEWIGLLVRQYGATARKEENWYRISSSSKSWADLAGTGETVALTPSPDSEASWRDRFRLVEKAAARAILAAPVGFSCKLIGDGIEPDAEAIDLTILRLAYGLSLSVGRCCRQRYTAYYVLDLDGAFYTSGEDELFSLDPQVEALDLEQKAVRSGLAPLFATVQETEQVYCAHNSVRTEAKRLQRSLLAQQRDLDRLYTINYGQYAKLRGRTPPGLRGEDAIEAEYMDKMEDIWRRHQPAVVFEPLTLGVVHCSAAIRSHGAFSEIRFPFSREQSFQYDS